MRSLIFRLACMSLVLACVKEGDTETAADGGSDEGDFCQMQLDALIPSDCRCVDAGEPCYQGCFLPDDMMTCDQVCAEIGETCVENECSEGTYLSGPSSGACPVPSEYGTTELLGCGEAVPADGSGAACCCTHD